MTRTAERYVWIAAVCLLALLATLSWSAKQLWRYHAEARAKELAEIRDAAPQSEGEVTRKAEGQEKQESEQEQVVKKAKAVNSATPKKPQDMIIRLGNEKSKPTINEEALKILNNPPAPTERFGLTEKERRQLWKESIWAADRATDEAITRYPDLQNKNAVMKQLDYENKLNAKYKAAVLGKYNITEEQYDEISAEGVKENWPIPKLLK